MRHEPRPPRDPSSGKAFGAPFGWAQPGWSDRYLIRDAQRIIESIESLVRIHNAQEEDIYEHAVDWGADDQSREGVKPDALRKADMAAPGPASQAAPKATSKLSWRWRMLAGALVLLIFAGGLYGGGSVHYVTQKVERGSIIRTVSTTGVVSAANTVPVETHVSGVIQALSCDVDTKVKVGQLCAKIGQRPYLTAVGQEKAKLAEAEARLEKDTAALTHAQAIFARDQIRAKRRAISPAALDRSRDAYERARARTMPDEASIAERQAALHAAESNLGNTDIVSPIDGIVVSRNVELGQRVAANLETRLFLIAPDPTIMQVGLTIGEKDIGEITLGDKASFTVDAFPNRLFAGEVVHISPSPRTLQNIVTYGVIIKVFNPDLLLKPAMRATIQIVAGRCDNALRAPDQALRYWPGVRKAPPGAVGSRTLSNDSSRLWILRDGRLTEIAVQLGLDEGTYTEIVEGDLQPGDELIIGEDAGVLERLAALQHLIWPTRPTRWRGLSAR